ncbi:Calx-beta domain-containing protein [Kibdelosporangium persicum]|uniref:von Willebrand factor type A domain-containing protein n=1 Tax=Kibdelosporangium persicum TaxID=2698649 RepID=A0ABX2F9X5_9PSEU|nr:Calx-beta domain-containing protein [Kibdelosporangium persicum]NRN68164.1 von Willebrand factor type A domain-containing protein [Kibdelosporangium persicum]
MPKRTLALTVASAALFAGFAVPAASAPAPVDPASVDFTLGPGGSATLTKKVTTPVVPPNPDIVLLGDTTGSMIDVMENVRANADAITDRILDIQPSARFAVAEYKHNVDGPLAFTVNQALTGSQEQVRAATQKWIDNAGGGGIPTTDFINAHYRIATDAIAFRQGGSRIVAWFGDARSANPSLGRTLQQAIGALQARGIRVVAVPIAGTDGGGLDNLGQATAITSQTGGRLMPGSSPAAVAQAVLDGVTNLDATVTHRLVDCASQLTTTLTPASQTVQSGRAVEFAETIAVKPGTAPGTYRCKVDFLINGASQGLAQTITVRVPGVQAAATSETEGETATIALSLDAPSRSPITVQYRTSDGTATAPADYAAVNGEVTFAPGETRKQITVRIVEDDYGEYDETFTVTLSMGGSVVDTATITIKDDDGGIITVHSCTANAVNLLSKKIAVANPAKTSCKNDTKAVASANLNAGLLSVQVGAVSAKTSQATSQASVGTVKITALGQDVEIGLIESQAAANCGKGKPAGGSKVGSLRIDGVAIPVGSKPVTVPLVVGSLKLNSTVKTATSVTQRAVALDTLAGDLVIAESQAACKVK